MRTAIMCGALMALAVIATAAQAYENVSLSIREPFGIGMTSTVYTGDRGVPENETVLWARPDVLFIGQRATPCLIDWVPGNIAGNNAKVFVCWLGLDNEYHRGPQGRPTLPR